MRINRVVEVVYCLPEIQHCTEIQFSEGDTARQAIENSGLLEIFGLELKGERASIIGIYGKQCTPDTVIKAGDRIEIYRPLLLSPTEARRLRAKTVAEKPSA